MSIATANRSVRLETTGRHTPLVGGGHPQARQQMSGDAVRHAASSPPPGVDSAGSQATGGRTGPKSHSVPTPPLLGYFEKGRAPCGRRPALVVASLTTVAAAAFGAAASGSRTRLGQTLLASVAPSSAAAVNIGAPSHSCQWLGPPASRPRRVEGVSHLVPPCPRGQPAGKATT